MARMTSRILRVGPNRDVIHCVGGHTMRAVVPKQDGHAMTLCER